MPATVTYHYIGNVAPTDLTNGVTAAITKTSEPSNPIFNFDQSFFSNLQSLNQTEIGQSQPFISLKLLGVDNQIISDLNLSFFSKTIDMEGIRTQLRYGDRPTMSLKEIQLKTDQASGYLYYTNVTLRIRVHKPDVLVSKVLIGLIFPGQPLLLEYGWNSPNPFLNQKEILSFAVKTYNVSMQTNGELDLTVEGMAYNERFNNTLIGDDNNDFTLTDNPNQKANKVKVGGIRATFEQLQRFQTELRDLQQRNDQNSNNNALIKELANDLASSEQRARGKIDGKFQTNFKRLNAAKRDHRGTDNKKVAPYISFHDVLHTMCNDTLGGLTHIFPSAEFRVIYGNFNENCGAFANKSIASYPINFKQCIKAISQATGNGKKSLTIEAFINLLIEKFINDKVLKTGQETTYNEPYIVVNFANRRATNGSRVIEMAILDANSGVPITTLGLPNGRSPPAQTVSSVVGNTGLPVLYLGHANSFIKSMNLSQYSDEYMKAVLIERMSSNRSADIRDTLLNRSTLPPDNTPPLTLPLKGTASLLGHIGWKPFRAFYLSTGIFFVDGVYKILSTTHTLSAEGYTTDIEFLYH